VTGASDRTVRPSATAFCRQIVTVLVPLAWLACARIADGHDADPPPLDFTPPAPGSYALHRIMVPPDGEVLGVDGHPRRLARFTHGRITLLGFVYTTCIDPGGCPLAYRVFDTLKRAILTTPSLHGKVRFVTLSFDPTRDSPAVMRQYAGSRLTEDGTEVSWYFLTTRSARELRPLIDGFGQDIHYTIDRSSGRPRRELSHVLKVFLIDPEGFVREIYTSTFLHPKTVLNDIETLRLEGRAALPAAGDIEAAHGE
jgi:protein SCO1